MLNHKGTKIIETQRLILRPFTMDDTHAMYTRWANDDEVTKFLTWPTHSGEEVSQMVLADWTSHYREPNFYNWAIVLKDLDDRPIGNISVVGVKEKTRCAVIGYCMGRAHWGKGIMPEALKAIIDFLFDEVDFNRIEADHAVGNPKSGRVMEKAGMTYEGTMRQEGLCNAGIIDVCRWAILKSDRREKEETL